MTWEDVAQGLVLGAGILCLVIGFLAALYFLCKKLIELDD